MYFRRIYFPPRARPLSVRPTQMEREIYHKKQKKKKGSGNTKYRCALSASGKVECHDRLFFPPLNNLRSPPPHLKLRLERKNEWSLEHSIRDPNTDLEKNAKAQSDEQANDLRRKYSVVVVVGAGAGAGARVSL